MVVHADGHVSCLNLANALILHVLSQFRHVLLVTWRLNEFVVRSIYAVDPFFCYKLPTFRSVGQKTEDYALAVVCSKLILVVNQLDVACEEEVAVGLLLWIKTATQNHLV